MMQMKEGGEEHKVVPADEQVDVRKKKFSWVGCDSRSNGEHDQHVGTDNHEANAKMCVDGFEMPDDGNGGGCVFLFLVILLSDFRWSMY